MNEIYKKYQAYPVVSNPNRRWPDRRIETAPAWCSVDLRDGNQALINPMNLEQKIRFFDTLVAMGFKEIEVGFPSAAAVEFDFLRYLIENDKIPDDVEVQVLTQAREHLIQKTMESLKGIKGTAILHLYNSTSVAQRDWVFEKSKEEIIDIAKQGVRWVQEYAGDLMPHLRFQYSPESFTGTELDYAIEICEAVHQEWGVDKPMIMNLPATVELSTPNIYADMIEVFLDRISHRDKITLSLHTHNDRGTGVAATELALLAGADRVEGTLFGNGERTGNVDIVTLALNMETQGLASGLDLSNLSEIVDVSDRCTEIPVHCRHPYAGELVFTAFSGSHQDAIKKGMAHQQDDEAWRVPYLSIDPKDIGRSYEAIVRINSQSGKGGVAYIMDQQYGCQLPRDLQIEFSKDVQRLADTRGEELQAADIWTLFKQSYLEANTPLRLENARVLSSDEGATVELTVSDDKGSHSLKGSGNGPIDACKKALVDLIPSSAVTAYYQHALDQKGAESTAIAYIQIEQNGRSTFGVGIDANIAVASIRAVFSALNRLA